jgi:holo-[acyl-carrier protein] synthase
VLIFEQWSHQSWDDTAKTSVIIVSIHCHDCCNILMPPRPFPFTLRLGTDICNVSRVRRLLARKGDSMLYLKKFTKRVLTEPECAYFFGRFGPKTHIESNLDTVSEFLAGRLVKQFAHRISRLTPYRFAAKEAIRKACDQFETSDRGFQSIIILPIDTAPRNKHQSTRPQGLILDRPYKPAQSVEQASGARSKDGAAGAFSKQSAMEMSVTADDLDGQLCEISISHDGMFATAVALVPLMEGQSTKVDSTETLRP